jgi:hypothetical protein
LKIQSIAIEFSIFLGLFLRTKPFLLKINPTRDKKKNQSKRSCFQSNLNHFRFKEASSWPAIAAHAKFEQYDWVRIINLYKD